ncbi:hypothetical protein WL29_21415 [Burkholderia ubonensis]|uniref:Uncharacterized protein n=1 Tax=Burkholderia ubonensis TaxID=101571 RepID=A0A106QCT9_9BURK|nr:hypothetical protein [Burkholderia ubonensis]KWA83928.1 hypothetical protein WL29_21415 [Burkholderia ubonensis]
MSSYFNTQHWNRVKKARAELGLNKIPEEATLRPAHHLAQATLQHRQTGETWKVTEVREDWLLGRYLTATLEREDGVRCTYVVEIISSEEPEILQQLGEFNTEFEVLFH